MSQSLGQLSIVLHGHLPYVLHHGSYPHGEAWLFEAAAETYLPILDFLGEAGLHGIRCRVTMGLMPVLLEQLAHERFKGGFVAYLHERAGRAEADRREFEAGSGPHDKHFAYLATRWGAWFQGKIEHFERIGRDIPGEFARFCREGQVQILTSNATHCYMPLVLNDEMLRAQMKCGVATSERHLGHRPTGMWLPECAYRPAWDHWLPSVLYDNARHRPGVEQFIAEAGVSHFFVDSHQLKGGRPLGYMDNGSFHTVPDDPSHWDARRGWRSTLEPVGVVSQPEAPSVYAFGRHPEVSEQVWSGDLGYPGAGEYMEFHRKHGERGLRYHKVTSRKTPLSDKEPYYPDDVAGKLHEHAHHFLDTVKRALAQHRDTTGRQGTVVASFDAELFGHWWFEGTRFLRDVIFAAHADEHVDLATAEEVLETRPPDKAVRLPEGSWGKNGDHTVWMNDQVKWMWEAEYRAEGEFLKQLHALPWRQNADVSDLLTKAARQLLLLQASDWPFVVESGGAVDYGTFRFSGHATRFGRLCDLAEQAAGGAPIGRLEQAQIEEADAHDDIFQHIDLTWWLP
jgi:1,4-alpha-glucan branching enzyme